jgi:tetratricopeptide (TPR) repeat protein
LLKFYNLNKFVILRGKAAKSTAAMKFHQYLSKSSLFILVFLLAAFANAQEIRGLKIYVDIAAGTYLKFQKPIDGIEGNFRDKGYNFKNRSGGNALNIIPPTDKPLEPAEIEISEGGRNHLFIITPYPKKYDPNIDPPFDYIVDNSDKIKRYIQQADQDRLNSGAATKPPVQEVKIVENTPAKPVEDPAKTNPSTTTTTATTIPAVKKPADDGYDANIAAGDKAFNEKNYYQAKVAYTEAYRIRINEKYPLTRIQLITRIEEEADAKVKLEEEKQKTIDANYTSELQKADRYLLNGEYSLARESYSKASQIKSQEPYPKNKIAEIDKLVKDLLAKEEADKLQKAEDAKRLAAEQEITDRYNAAISKADKAFAARQYDAARLAYSDALKIKPGEKFPDDKLTEIADIKNANEAKAAEKIIADRQNELNTKYNALIIKGDKALNEKQFTAAKDAYNAALALKPADNLAQSKLVNVDNEISKSKAAELEQQNIAKQKALNDKYIVTIAKADKAFAAKNYGTAKTEYYNAQTLKPGEAYPQNQLAIIDGKLSETAAAVAREKEVADKYKKAIAAADNAFVNKDYDLAKMSYNSALETKPGDAYSRGKIAAIEKIEEEIAIQKSQTALKELNDRYEASAAAGDKAYSEKDYATAKKAYEQAADLMPNKPYPASQLKLIQHKEYEQAELEKTEKFNGFIALADKAFASKSYDEARGYYEKALEVRPDEVYPKKQIAITKDPGEIERIAKREELKVYNQLRDEGDNAFKQGKYDEAKTKYKKALEMQPDVPYLIYKINQSDEAIAALVEAEKTKQKETAQKALDENFNALVLSGEKAFGAGDMTASKKYYKEALDVKPNDPIVTEKIITIDKRIAQVEKDSVALALAQQKNKDLNERFTGYVSKADKAYDEKKYDEAKASYDSALLLKPDDKYTRDRIDQIEKNVVATTEAARVAEVAKTNQDEINNNYNAAIQRADKALDAKLYYEAKAAYTDALTLKPGEALPKAKLGEIEKALAQENAAKKATAKTTEIVPAKSVTTSTLPGQKGLPVQQVALPYNQAELFKRYNTINFYDPPPGQKLVADAFFASDTLENYNLSQSIIAEAPRLDISDSANGVRLTLQAINFEGSSAYLKMRIQNFGKKEFLTGKMLFSWYRKDGSKLDYYGSYITAYPYLLPGKEITIIYVTRAANPSTGEVFGFVMDDRLRTTKLELEIPAEVYNSEYDR